MEDLLVATRMKGVLDLFDFHSHDYNELVLLHGGNCRFLVGNQFFPLQPGDLLMLDGNMTHKAYVHGDPDVYERSVLHFKTNWIKPVLEELQVTYLLDLFTENKNGMMRHYPHKKEAFIEGKMKEIEAIWQGVDHEIDNIDMAQLKLLVVQLLIYLFRSDDALVRKEDTNRDEKTKLVESISNYLFSNYQHPITIDDVAHEVGLTKSYMSHLFKEVTGNTIMSYLMAYRLSKARNRLTAEPNLSIKQVSLDCGFKSEAHFSRLFKQKIGVSPSEYRINRVDTGGLGDHEEWWKKAENT